MSRAWNECDAAQALLAAYRNDYRAPGRRCSECHCEECLPLLKKPCCTLGLLLMQAERIVKTKRKVRGIPFEKVLAKQMKDPEFAREYRKARGARRAKRRTR